MYRNDNKREWFVVIDQEDGEIGSMMRSGNIRLNDVKTDEDVLGFTKGLLIRRVVHDVDAFREKILLSDNNYDDRIIELMKLSLSRLIKKETNIPVYRIFLEETAGSQLEFTAILGNRPPFEYCTVKSVVNAYNQFRNKYMNVLGRPEDDEYIFTDQKWAAQSGLLKDGDDGFGILL